MNNKKFTLIKITLFLVISASFTSIVRAQINNKSSNDEFYTENIKRLERRKQLENDLLKQNARQGIRGQKPIVADDDPGATGLLLLQQSSRSKSASTYKNIEAMSFSTLRSLIMGNTPISTSVYSISSKENVYAFSNYLKSDPGYVADPFWIDSGNQLILKSGRYDGYGGYYLYTFDKRTKRIHRISSQFLKNRDITVSPAKQYLVYVVGGGTLGPDAAVGGTDPLELWVWDSITRKNHKICSSDSIEGAYAWKSAHELSYSMIESRNGLSVPIAYIWDAKTGKSKFWKFGCQSPVTSPDGKYVVYSKSLDEKANYSENNSIYVIEEMVSGKLFTVPRVGLGKFSFNRQLMWSPDSKAIFSILNKPTQAGHRLFIFNVSKRTSSAWPVVKPDSYAKIVAISSKGKRAFLLRQDMINEKPNKLDAFNWRFNLASVNSSSGNQSVIFSKDYVLGLSSNSIKLTSNILKD